MASRFNLKSNLSKINPAPTAAKSNVFLGLSLASLMVVLLVKWIPALAMTLPIFGISAVGYWLWTEFQQEQDQQRKRQAAVDAKFYKLLRQQQGRISVLDFAMHAQLTGPAAQAYLNRQAQTFPAYTFSAYPGTSTAFAPGGIDAPGNVSRQLTYVFELTGPLMDLSGPAVNTAAGNQVPKQAEAVWAIAEQTRRQQARRNQAHAAWANAKQLRNLHKLSRIEPAAAPLNTGHIRQINDGNAQGLATRPSIRTSSQASGNSQPTPIQAGYIAISTIDSQGKEQSSYPNRHPDQDRPTQPNTSKLATESLQKRHHSDEAFTIDVPAIRG